MKTSFTLLALSIATFSIAQSNEFKLFQLDTKEPVTDCKITAYVDNLELESGYIESIQGSIITLRIAENTDYLIHINDTKTFEISASNDIVVERSAGQVNESEIIYRVQIGAFSEPIPSSYYVDFTSIFLEKKEGSEITRLMTGNYNSLLEAKSVKNQLLNEGFTDAFIVAYYNGERIEYAEAIKMEQQFNQAKNTILTAPLVNPNNSEIASSNQKD